MNSSDYRLSLFQYNIRKIKILITNQQKITGTNMKLRYPFYDKRLCVFSRPCINCNVCFISSCSKIH